MFMAFIISKHALNLENHSVIDYHGVLYEGTRFDSNHIMNQMQTPIFIFRRLLFALTLVILVDYPMLQILTCTFLSLITLIYYL